MKSKVVTAFIYLHDSFYKEIPLEMHGKIVFSLKKKIIAVNINCIAVNKNNSCFFFNGRLFKCFQRGDLQTDVAAEISLVFDTTPNSWKTHNV